MKKIINSILSICIGLSLCACSGQKKEDVMVFFDAFDKTLDLDSGTFSGNVKYIVDEDVSNMLLEFSIIQMGDMQLSTKLGIEANGNKIEDFISFYIKDGKTYLNYMGQTSQSVAENIGVNPKKKLSISNPFLDFTDSELAALFSKVEKKNNVYTMEIKASTLSTLLDEFGGINVDSAIIVATIDHGYISKLSFNLEGQQTFDDSTNKIKIEFNGNLDNINSLTSVEFPENLASY